MPKNFLLLDMLLRYVLLSAALVFDAVPAAAQFSEPAVLPTYASGNALAARVGLACNGDAAIAWNTDSAFAWVATRRNGAWETEGLGGDDDPPELAMNDRGDLVVAWRASGEVCVRYRPADGAFENERCFNDWGDFYRPSIALSEAGTAIVTWVEGAFVNDAYASVHPAGATAWGNAEFIATDISVTIDSIAVPSALDNAGNAIVAWHDAYATYNAYLGSTRELVGVRTRVRSGGSGTWGDVSDVTPRPIVNPLSPGVVPSYNTPSLAADPVSGALLATFIGATDALMPDTLGGSDEEWQPDFENNRLWESKGSVTGGLGAISEFGAGRIGALETAGAPGFFAVAGWLGNPGSGGPGSDPSAGRSASASTPVLETIGPPRFGSTSFLARGVDVGADGTAAVTLDGEVWISGPLLGFSGPLDPLETREVDDIAVNCAGDVLVAGATAGFVDEEVRYAETPEPGAFAAGVAAFVALQAKRAARKRSATSPAVAANPRAVASASGASS